MSLDMSWDISVSSIPCTPPSPSSPPAPPSPSPRVASRDARPAVSSAYNQLVGKVLSQGVGLYLDSVVALFQFLHRLFHCVLECVPCGCRTGRRSFSTA